MSSQSDLSKVAVTDEASVESLYRRYSGWLTKRLRGRFGAELAEELMQETYLRIAPYKEQGTIKHPRALLLRIATNIGVDLGRRSARAADCRPASDSSTQPPQFERVLLQQVVLSLPEPLRDVFVLSRFAGLTYEEIAARLGLSVKTVEWRMSKALAHCAVRLRPQATETP